MKAPLSWLKEFVDIDCSAEELKNKLFSCGFEVEGMEYVGENIKKVVTCKITKIEKHPNADKLFVTQVDAGEYGVLPIVTNAKNVFEGAIVPVALDGATLFDGTKIKEGNLRGVKSCGMFCGYEELGITPGWYAGDENGVLIFKEEYPLGKDVCEILDLKDVMFDINVTANRPDCQSIYGLAREVSAVLDKPLKEVDLSYKAEKGLKTEDAVSVSVCDSDLCPRYVSVYVSDVSLFESPYDVKRKLLRMGIRPINNIVDITNLVLLEIGQPMHAFDLSDLNGNKIIVRRANSGEKIVTLDEKEFSLNPETLVICDGVKPVALAGIMGGLNSEIKDTTKNVVFESAKFARDNIRKTSRALSQRSDSSSRFEKGVDAYSCEIGMKRALHYVSALGCGKIAESGFDIHPDEIKEKVLKTKISKINGVLGIDVPCEQIKSILERLFFKTEISGDDITVSVPCYREDVDDYPDLAEEIIREYGYDFVKPSLLASSSITNGGKNDKQKRADAVKNLLAGYGFNEIITYSFVSEKDYDIFEIEKPKLVKLINPLGEDMSVMRTTLVPSIVRTVCYNLNRKNNEGRLFELANVYNVDSEGENGVSNEKLSLSFAVFGENEDFFTAKGVLEGLFNEFCFGEEFYYVPCDKKFLHKGRSAYVLAKNGEQIGYFGQLNPSVAEKLDVDKPIFVGELNYEVFEKYVTPKIVYKPVSKFPTVERDIAILVDSNVPCADIISEIKKHAGKYCESVSLFDVYTGDQVKKGKKSMAFNINFVSNEKTLEVEEIDKAINKVLDGLKEIFGAELR